jgi:hypothetical protein
MHVTLFAKGRAGLLVASLALALLGGLSTPSRADFAINPGKNPQTDENVLLNSGTTGTTVTGNTNQTGLTVSFSSGQSLSEPSNGQARIEDAGGGALLGLTDISVPGGSFTSLIFNLNNGSGDASITVNGFDAANNPETLTVSNLALGNGSNFFTITAINGERITSVNYSAPGGSNDIRQIRIGGAAVPEPASLALLSLGFGAVVVYSRHRRARSAN